MQILLTFLQKLQCYRKVGILIEDDQLSVGLVEEVVIEADHLRVGWVDEGDE